MSSRRAPAYSPAALRALSPAELDALRTWGGLGGVVGPLFSLSGDAKRDARFALGLEADRRERVRIVTTRLYGVPGRGA